MGRMWWDVTGPTGRLCTRCDGKRATRNRRLRRAALPLTSVALRAPSASGKEKPKPDRLCAIKTGHLHVLTTTHRTDAAREGLPCRELFGSRNSAARSVGQISTPVAPVLPDVSRVAPDVAFVLPDVAWIRVGIHPVGTQVAAVCADVADVPAGVANVGPAVATVLTNIASVAAGIAPDALGLRRQNQSRKAEKANGCDGECTSKEAGAVEFLNRHGSLSSGEFVTTCR